MSPPLPAFLNATDDSIFLEIKATLSNGGSPLAAYKLYFDNATATSPSIELDSGDLLGVYEVKRLDLNLVVGSIYRFVVSATNEAGFESERVGQHLSVALGSAPLQLATPYLNASSDPTLMEIKWVAVSSASSLPLLYYTVYWDAGVSGASLASKACAATTLLSCVVQNLSQAASYSFEVVGVNYNGEGPRSETLRAIACSAPSDVQPPARVSTTKDSVSVRWTHPGSSGGCPITSYWLLRDDGNGGPITTEAERASTENKAYLF